MQIRLVATVKGFDYYWLSCQKKSILKNIGLTRRLKKFQNLTKIIYKWFQEIDEWHDNMASTHNQIPASTLEL